MTALTQNDRFISLSPTAGTTVLAYDFELMLDVGMSVTRVRAGASTPLVLGVDFSFPGGIGNETGGTLTLAVASLAADVYLLVGAQPEQRLSDFVNSQKFDSAKMNADLDALTIVAQEHRRDIDRAWKSPYGSGGKSITAGSSGEIMVADATGNIVGGGTTIAVLLSSVSGYALAAAASATAASNSAASAAGSAGAAASSAAAAATAAATLTYASQAEAEAGAVGNRVMSPLQTRQAVMNGAFFNSGDTGSADVKLFNILMERIRASDYGVDPTNTAANNRLGIQRALNKVGSRGGMVMLPAKGDIPLDSTTINMTAGAMLDGQGDWSRLVTNNASNNMIDIAAAWSTIRDVYFGSSVTRTGGYAVRYLPGGGRAQMKDFHIEAFVNGVYVGNTVSVRIEKGRLMNFIATTGIGVRFDAGLDMLIDDILMDASAQIFAGVYITNVGDLKLFNSQLIHAGNGLLVEPGAGQNVTSLWVDNTDFDNCGRGAYLHAVGAGAIIARSKLTDCWFSSALTEGIRMETASGGIIDGIKLTNPDVYLNAGGGVYLVDSGVTNVRLLGPEISKNTGDGFKTGSGVTKWSIIGGHIGDGAGFSGGGNTGNGITVGATNDKYKILGVDLQGNSGSALSGHTFGTGKVVQANLPYTVNDNGQRIGTATNDAAAAGNVGEYVESVVLSGAAVALVTATGKTITSISLQPGDWDIDGVAVLFPANTTNVTQLAASISGSTNNTDTTPGRYAEPPFPSTGFVYNGTKAPHIPLPTQRVSISVATTYYLVALAAFTVAGVSAFGTIRARRVR